MHQYYFPATDNLLRSVFRFWTSDVQSFHIRFPLYICGVLQEMEQYSMRNGSPHLFPNDHLQLCCITYTYDFQINYNQALPFFHTFETDDRQAGLNFANEDEAYHFFAMVHEKVRLLQKRREGNQVIHHV